MMFVCSYNFPKIGFEGLQLVFSRLYFLSGIYGYTTLMDREKLLSAIESDRRALADIVDSLSLGTWFGAKTRYAYRGPCMGRSFCPHYHSLVELYTLPILKARVKGNWKVCS